MSIRKATVVGMVFGAATVAGQVVGAKVGQNLYNRRARNQALLMGVRSLRAFLFPCRVRPSDHCLVPHAWSM